MAFPEKGRPASVYLMKQTEGVKQNSSIEC